MTSPKSYAIFNATAPRAIASTTNASPIVVTTDAPHGYATGDKIAITGHEVNTNANGYWDIVVTSDTTYELVGSEGNGVGGATGTNYIRAKYASADDFRNAVLSLVTDGGGTAAMTVKVVGSIQRNPPDFAKPSSVDNQWSTVQVINLENSTEINGDTGIVLAGEDLAAMYEININHLTWVSCILEGTAGEITAKISVAQNT
jgi:hypothetical protein